MDSHANLFHCGPGHITVPLRTSQGIHSFLNHVQMSLSMSKASYVVRQQASFLSSLTPTVLLLCNLDPSPVGVGKPEAWCPLASSMTLFKPFPSLCLLPQFKLSKFQFSSKVQCHSFLHMNHSSTSPQPPLTKHFAFPALPQQGAPLSDTTEHRMPAFTTWAVGTQAQGFPLSCSWAEALSCACK